MENGNGYLYIFSYEHLSEHLNEHLYERPCRRSLVIREGSGTPAAAKPVLGGGPCKGDREGVRKGVRKRSS